MVDKKSVGRPKKPATFKPSLRCSIDKWQELQLKYPKQLNKMFNEWINTL